MIWNLLYRQGWSQIYQDPMLRNLIITDYSILCIGNKLKTKNRMFNFQTSRKTKIKKKWIQSMPRDTKKERYS